VALTYERGRCRWCGQFPVRGGAPRVGVDEKATRGGEGGNGLLWVCRLTRKEENGGRETAARFRVEQREQEGERVWL
jgi:hypothetical protein